LRLRGLRVGALPILNRFIERMGLEEELTLALKNPGYADALLATAAPHPLRSCKMQSTGCVRADFPGRRYDPTRPQRSLMHLRQGGSARLYSPPMECEGGTGPCDGLED
jgi:hypothetical protein